jgi:hypothetical protein
MVPLIKTELNLCCLPAEIGKPQEWPWRNHHLFA